MEFIFQLLAQLLPPVDEKEAKKEAVEVKAAEERKEEIKAEAEKTGEDQPNLFGMFEFH